VAGEEDVAKVLGIPPWQLPVAAMNLSDVGMHWPEYKAKIEGTGASVSGMSDLPSRMARNEQDISALRGDVSQLDSLLGGKADKSDLNNLANKNDIANLDGRISNNESAISSIKADTDGMKKPVNDWVDAMDFFNALPGKYPVYKAAITGGPRGLGGTKGIGGSLNGDTKDRIDALFLLGSRVDPDSFNNLVSSMGDVNMKMSNMTTDISRLQASATDQNNKLADFTNRINDNTFKIKGLDTDLKDLENKVANLPTGGAGVGADTIKSVIDYSYLNSIIDSSMVVGKLTPTDIQDKIGDGWLKSKIEDFAPAVPTNILTPDNIGSKFPGIGDVGKIAGLSSAMRLSGPGFDDIVTNLGNMQTAITTFTGAYQDPSGDINSMSNHAATLQENREKWDLKGVIDETFNIAFAGVSALIKLAADVQAVKTMVDTIKTAIGNVVADVNSLKANLP